jgi:riboflavin biosynthesis pyrimidine reductase
MTVRANLVIGADGSTAASGSSKQLSSPEDRKRFHELRKGSNFILIGGNTARNEPYLSTPIPLIVVSKSSQINEIKENPIHEILNLSPQDSLEIGIKKYGPDVVIEGGPNFLIQIISKVDELFITISNRTGDGQVVSFDGLTRNFIMEDMEKIEGDIFYKFMKSK